MDWNDSSDELFNEVIQSEIQKDQENIKDDSDVDWGSDGSGIWDAFNQAIIEGEPEESNTEWANASAEDFLNKALMNEDLEKTTEESNTEWANASADDFLNEAVMNDNLEKTTIIENNDEYRSSQKHQNIDYNDRSILKIATVSLTFVPNTTMTTVRTL